MKKLFAMLVVFLLLATFGCKKESKTVTKQMATAQKIAKIEQDVDAKQQQMNSLLQKYAAEGGQNAGSLMGKNLTPEQKKELEDRLKSEKGIGYKDLISDILGKQKQIEDLRVQIQDLEKTLPSAVTVRRGDSHYNIAMNFLTKDKGLDPATAKKLVLRVNLMDELVPGFKVWNFYDNGVYGSFVTQGDASVSPYTVIKRTKHKLVTAKNQAISQRDELKKQKTTLLEQVSDLQKRRDQLNQDVALLQAQREDMLKQLQQMHDLSDDLKARLNSVFYTIGERKALVTSGVVKDPWYGKARLTNFKEDSYPNHMDLRSEDTIKFTAKDVGVASIKRIKVAPEATFKAGVDYIAAVLSDGAEGQVKILNKDKFKAQRTMAIMIN